MARRAEERRSTPHTPIVAARDAIEQCGVARVYRVELHDHAAISLLAYARRHCAALERADNVAAGRVLNSDDQTLVMHCAGRGGEGPIETGWCRDDGSGRHRVIGTSRQRQQARADADEQGALYG